MSRWPLLLPLFCALLHLEADAQVRMPDPLGHVPIGTTVVPEGLKEGYDARLKEQIAALPAHMPKAVREDIVKRYKARAKSIVEDLDGDELLFGHPINAYLDSMLQAVLNANPELGRDVRLLVERSAVPNAYCMGDGTLVFSLGLMGRLETESQIAFVLCHELAHQHLDHVEKGIRERAARLHDEEFSKALKQAQRQKYDRMARIEELALDFTVERRRHGRLHENEADSLALVLISRTGFSLGAGMASMDIMDVIDREPFARPLDIQAALEAHGVTFKPEWVQDVKASSLGYFERESQAIDDSLKTHPDCMVRKAALSRQLDRMGGEAGTTDPRGAAQTMAVRTISTLELVDRYMVRNNPCRALYLALRALADRPDDVCLHAMVGRAMATFHARQKARTIGEVLDLTNNAYNDSYNRTITFVTDLRLSEYAEIGYQYLAAERQAGTENGELLYALALTGLAMDRKDEARASAERYRSLHPQGRHIAKLAELFP